MSEFMAENAVIRLAKGGQRQGVGRSAVENKENLALGFEDIADEVSGFGGPGIIAIAADMAAIGLKHLSPSLRADAGVIVTGEMAAAVYAISHFLFL
jgi:hypothetical protein